MAVLLESLHAINEAIGDRHYHLGVSFFLVKDLAKHLPEIWELEIEPFLEEYFFDRPSQMDAFRCARLRARLEP